MELITSTSTWVSSINYFKSLKDILIGCKFHPGCCIPDSQIENADKQREQWEEKSNFFNKHGVLIVMRECAWKRFKSSQLNLPHNTALVNVLHVDDETSLLKGIEDNSLFGFLKCDVTTPTELIEEYEQAGYLFPPVIQRATITEEMLSPYMRQRYLEEAKTPSETVIQSYHGKQVFVMSTMVNRWLKMGLKVSNVTQFIQYQPGHALAPFVKKVTEGRIAATYEKDEAKSNTYKLFGNGGELNKIIFIHLKLYLRLWKMWRGQNSPHVDTYRVRRRIPQQTNGQALLQRRNGTRQRRRRRHWMGGGK